MIAEFKIMTKREVVLKILQETYYVRRLFESCKTQEQVKNVNNLACYLVGKKWPWYENEFSLSNACEIARAIDIAANDMTSFYYQAKDRVKKQRKNN